MKNIDYDWLICMVLDGHITTKEAANKVKQLIREKNEVISKLQEAYSVAKDKVYDAGKKIDELEALLNEAKAN